MTYVTDTVKGTLALSDFDRDDRITEELEDAQLLAVAEERLSHYDPAKTISWEEMNAYLGITEEDLANCEEVELE